MNPFPLNKLRIPVSEFWSLPEKERTVIVLLGVFLNEINWLVRLLVKTDQSLRESTAEHRLNPEQEAAEALVALISTTLVGKVYESWCCLAKPKGKSPSLLDFLARSGLALSEDTKTLKATFEKKLSNKLFKRIRNELAFHYDAKKLNVEKLRGVLTDADTHVFLHPDEAIGFTLSRLGTVTLFEAIIGRVSVSDRASASAHKISEIIETTDAFTSFAAHLLVDILKPVSSRTRYTKISIPDAPSIDDDSQPLKFFLHPPKNFSQNKKS